jgi:O-antigen/teichoic acid export membrane protein
MVLNFLLNLLLISRFGFMGATVAALISIAIYVGLQMPFVFRRLIKFEFKEMLGGFVRIALSALAMSTFIFLLRDVNVLAVLPLSFLVYAMSAYLFGVISENDQALIFRLIKKTA